MCSKSQSSGVLAGRGFVADRIYLKGDRGTFKRNMV